MARETSSAEQNGRAASCTSTMSGARALSASRPARTEACRVAPPGTGAQQPQALGGRLVGRAVVGMDDRLHRADLAMPGEQRQARADHRFARQLAVLLGQIAAGAKPASGCDDHGGNRRAHA